MALSAGNTACSTGLSKRIYDALTAASGNGFSSPLSSGQTDAVKALSYSIASAVVAEIAANAAVSVVVSADAFGAAIPAAPVTLTGSVS